MAPRSGTADAVPRHQKASELEAALRAWWEEEQSSWEVAVDEGLDPEEELWDDMPDLDSKMVARTSGLFEEHLGVPLQVELIRPGGYETIDDMIDHLVPAMVEVAANTDMKDTGP